MRIFKYLLKLQELNTLPMPENARILSFQMQGDVPTLWAYVDPLARRTSRSFRIVGTGNEVPPECNFESYIGTVQDRGYVWHLFEVR